MIVQNPGVLLESSLQKKDISISELKEILGYTANQTVKDRIEDFKEYKGLVKTFLKYCRAIEVEVEFLLIDKEADIKYQDQNLAQLLEKIRDKRDLKKKEFAKQELDLSNYSYTYHSFQRNGCGFQKLYDIFQEKLGFEIKYLVKEDY